LEKGEMLVIGNVGDSVIKLKSGPLDAAVRQVQVEDTGNLDKLQKSLGFAGNGTILTLPGIEA
jgi:hypothetical protein